MVTPVETACPSCATALRVPPTAFGKKIKCKHCGHAFVLLDPAEGDAAVQPSANDLGEGNAMNKAGVKGEQASQSQTSTRRVARHALWAVPLVLLVVAIGLWYGFKKKPPPPPPTELELVEALAPLGVKYKMNDEGHVYDLKLEGKLIDDAAVEQIRNFPKLKNLSLYGSSVTDEGLANLKTAYQLEGLGLGMTDVSRRGLTHLERLPALRHMWLSTNGKVTAKDREDFKKKAVPGITIHLQ